MIVEENYLYIKTKHPGMLGLKISDLRIGSYLLALKLSNGTYGISSPEQDHTLRCKKEKRDFGDFTPLKITGKSLEELFGTPKDSGLVRALRVAALNAVSRQINDINGNTLIRNSDLTDLLRPGKDLKIGMVGSFHSYIDRLTGAGRNLQILELENSAIVPEYAHLYHPASEYKRILPGCDIVIITGMTFVNNTFDHLLQVCRPDAQIAVIGPSSSLIARVLFDKNVDIIGGTRITDPELLFKLVEQGAAGYHLFRYCAEKVFILNEEQDHSK